MDEEVLEQAVKNSITILEKGQRTRLKYLAAAYIVIWLVFMLYVLRLGQQQQALDKRLAQLEQTSDDSPLHLIRNRRWQSRGVYNPENPLIHDVMVARLLVP